MPILTLRPADGSVIGGGTYSQFVEVPNAGFTFGDQFESNDFSAWTGTNFFGTAPVVEALNPHSGNYDFRSTITTGNCWVYKIIAAQTSFYTRFYIKFLALPTMTSGKYFYISPRIRTNSATITNLALYYTGSNYKWLLMNNVTSVSHYSGNITISAGVWYCIELYCAIDPTNGSLQLTFDNTQQIFTPSTTNINTGSTAITNVYLGLDIGAGTNVVTAYYDDFVISSFGPIGLENRAALVDGSSNTTALQVKRVNLSYANQETETLASTTQTGTITSVEVHFKALASNTVDGAVSLLLTQSTLYAGILQPITKGTLLGSGGASDTTGFQESTPDIYTTNPYTGVAWTWSDINQLQVGAQAAALAANDVIQFSQFYININFTTQAPQKIVIPKQLVRGVLLNSQDMHVP